MKKRNEHSWLLRLAIRVCKYCLLGLFGIVIVCLLSAGFGISSLLELLISLLRQWLGRVTVIVICLWATAVVIESTR